MAADAAAVVTLVATVAAGFVLGLAAVVLGAELLVRGASRAARGFGIPPLVIGLTVVAYGTSAPELAVSVSASTAGSPDLAVANVVGSNVFNVLAILGLCALIAPVTARSRVVRREIPIMLAVTIGFLALAADATLSRLDAVPLLLAMIVITVLTLRAERQTAGAADARTSGALRPTARALVVDAALVLAGLAALVLGARGLVGAAGAAAAALGVSELIVGLTIVAAGTSLPELATSIVALLRGQRDIAIGNVVGSNVFNVAGILGVSAAVAPTGLGVADQVVALDMWVMLAAAALLLPLAWTGGALVRWEGVVLLGGYVAYTAVVVAVATGSLPMPSATVGIAASAGFAAIGLVSAIRVRLASRRGGG